MELSLRKYSESKRQTISPPVIALISSFVDSGRVSASTLNFSSMARALSIAKTMNRSPKSGATIVMSTPILCVYYDLRLS